MSARLNTDKRVVAFRRRVGAAMRRWREQDACLTREELAPRVGLSVRTLERLESGASDLRLSDLRQLEKIHKGLAARLLKILSPDLGKPVNRAR